jgi:hypothetical protein
MIFGVTRHAVIPLTTSQADLGYREPHQVAIGKRRRISGRAPS